MSANFDAWRRELLLTGDIVQDGDASVSWPDRERRFKRYVELVDAISGNEGADAVIALLDSLQAKEDYGAYQSAYGALRRFPASVVAQGLVVALPRLIERQRDCAGDILAQLANARSSDGLSVLAAFRKELGLAPEQTKAGIMVFVEREEDGGWLDGRRKGTIRPSGAEQED